MFVEEGELEKRKDEEELTFMLYMFLPSIGLTVTYFCLTVPCLYRT